METFDCCKNPKCIECKGTGTVSFPAPKHSINLGNRNFETLWNALGLEWDHCGNVTPAKLKAALIKFNPELAVHKNETEISHNFISSLDGSALMVNLGWPLKSIEMRVNQLLAMCEYAAQKEEFIAWG